MSDNFSGFTATDLLTILNDIQGTPHEIESVVTGWVDSLSTATDTDLLMFTGKLRVLGITTTFIRDWQQAIKSCRKNRKKTPHPPQLTNPHPYFERDNKLYLRLMRGNDDVDEISIASFSARIINEILSESGGRSFTITGQTASGHEFSFTLPVADFNNDRQLASAIVQAGGVTAVIRAGMARHLPSAIQLLTDQSPRIIRQYCRTGWLDEKTFLIPWQRTGKRQNRTSQ